MKNKVVLTIASLLSIIFFTFHHADDVVRGMAPGNLSNLVPVVSLAIWLYATTLAFAERRAGYIIILILSLLGFCIPIVHMTGAGLVGGDIARSSGAVFFVWTLIALGVSTLFSVILSARELWSQKRDKLPSVQQPEL